jgi:hypothetical protein
MGTHRDRGSRLTQGFPGRWVDLVCVAVLLFLTTMVAAAVVLIAGKLQFASLGAGAGPFDVLRAIGLIALGSLGATVDLDGLQLSVIPLGSLVTAIVITMALSGRAPSTGRRHLGDAAVVGAVHGLLALLAASIFRFGGGVPVQASRPGSFLYGVLWGAVAAGLGSWWSRDRRLYVRMPAPAIDALSVAAPAGLAATAGTFVALLCVVIARLVSGPLPATFGVGDALAAILYLLAFLPNVLIAIFALAVGATLEIGAQIDVDGALVGPLRSISLWDWPGGGPGARWLLLILPIGTGLALGRSVATRLGNGRRALLAIVLGSLVFAIVVGMIAAIGDARLGAGLVREEGVASIAARADEAMILTFVWLTGMGIAAWGLSEWTSKRSERNAL